MSVGSRIKERLKAKDMSQAELARRVGVRQSTINELVRGESQSSKHLHQIARHLGTTPEYLSGETDDPENTALAIGLEELAQRYPLPPVETAPEIQLVTLQVALPSEAALTRMFEGLLRPLDRDIPAAELARILARRLPTGLAQLQGLRGEPGKGASPEADEAPQAPARSGRGSRPAPRT